MPFYEYQCVRKHITERWRKSYQRDHPVRCNKCDGRTKRVPSVFEFDMGADGTRGKR